jgi:preprotein translocase subunit SecD
MQRVIALLLGGLLSAGTAACSGPRRPALPAAQLKQLFYVARGYPNAAPDRVPIVVPTTFSGDPSGSSETLYVETQEVFSLAQVRDVSYKTMEGHKALVFLLTAEGRNRMSSATSSHVGGRLVIFVEGKVESAPVVMEPITDGRFYVFHQLYSDDQRRTLEQKLRAALGY